MTHGTRYFVEYSTVSEDEEKEIVVTRTQEFSSIISVAKWMRVLPSRCRIGNKYKTHTEKFGILDEGELRVEVSRKAKVSF